MVIEIQPAKATFFEGGKTMNRHRLTNLRTAWVLLILMGTLLGAGAAKSQTPEPIERVSPATPARVDSSASTVSTVFSYQGELRDASGQLITNPALPMTFRIFPGATGGTACWTENHMGRSRGSSREGGVPRAPG